MVCFDLLHWHHLLLCHPTLTGPLTLPNKPLLYCHAFLHAFIYLLVGNICTMEQMRRWKDTLWQSVLSCHHYVLETKLRSLGLVAVFLPTETSCPPEGCVCFFCLFLFFGVFFCVFCNSCLPLVLVNEPRALHLFIKSSTIELNPQPP